MDNSNLYLKDCLYVEPFSGRIFDGDIEVEKGKEGNLRFLPKGSFSRNFIDCKGKIVTRSFINSHHHIYSSLARGMPPPLKAPGNFHEILKFIWWKLDVSLNREMIEVSALTAAVESLRNGVTFVIDHHSSPGSISGSLELISLSLKRAGINSLVCYELSDRNGPELLNKALEESESVFKSGIPALVGLHASFTVSDELLKKSVGIAEKYNSGIHIHVAESQMDNDISLETYGKRAVKRLKDSGVLEFPKTLLAHSIHINEEERKLIAESPVMIVRNPRSNLNNGVGIFDDTGLEGKILIGTDGINSDILSDVKLYYYLNGGRPDNSPWKAYNSLRRADGYLMKNSFISDRENDLLIIDYKSPTDINKQNFFSHFIYGITSADIKTVISVGEVVMENGVPVGIDQDDLLSRSRELGSYLWKKISD